MTIVSPSEMVVVIPINDLSKRDVMITGLQEIKVLKKGKLIISSFL